MIRLLLLLVLMGCAPALHGTAPGVGLQSCGADRHQALVGQNATALERIYILGQVRVIRPDTMVTKDLRVDRLNFIIDGAEVITSVTCG